MFLKIQELFCSNGKKKKKLEKCIPTVFLKTAVPTSTQEEQLNQSSTFLTVFEETQETKNTM